MRGTPDFQQIERPSYRGAQMDTWNNVVVASDETVLATLYGPGIIWGGGVVLNAEAGQEVSIPEIICDGEYIANLKFEDLNKFVVIDGLMYPLFLTRYDTPGGNFTVGISRGYMFERTFTLAYLEMAAATPLVTAQLIYSLL